MKMFAQAVFAPHPPLPTVHLQVLVKFNGNGEDDHDDDNDVDDDDDGGLHQPAAPGLSASSLAFPDVRPLLHQVMMIMIRW